MTKAIAAKMQQPIQKFLVLISDPFYILMQLNKTN